jgi:outer membrane protein assembly factor BamB
MWRCDPGHTAQTFHELPPTLQLQWVREYSPRVPVWDDPLNQDMMPYDRIFEPVVAGRLMFVSFNDADKVVALDVASGAEVWSFYTDGPVRFSPAVHKGSVYATCDDGYLYCLAAADGTLRWRFRGGPSDRRAIGNSRVISSWPARGGPVVAGDTVYFAASIWPFMGTFIYALDAETGKLRWLNDDTSAEFQKQPHSAPSFAGVAPQGQLALAGDLLLVPGGRSLPAGFDRHTGKLRFFNFGGKGEGGSFVVADDKRAFVHTRVRGTMELSLPDGKATKLRTNEPVLAGNLLYTAVDAKAATDKEKATPAMVAACDRAGTKVWEVEADAGGDLILAGNRLYAAGRGSITAIDLPRGEQPAKIVWSLPVEGEVVRLLAAADRLFAVTLDGRIMAFGHGQAEPRILTQEPIVLDPADDKVEAAKHLLESTGQRQGYALWFGIDDPELLETVVLQSELHVVAVDPDAEKIARLRKRFDAAGLYGSRIALHAGTIDSYAAPPYIANLVVVRRTVAAGPADAGRLRQVYESVRPYGGKLWIGPARETATGGPGDPLAFEALPGAKVETLSSETVVTRQGALPGAADWTHAYGNVANTVKSDDSRVKLPLGILWFGGPSNVDVLPRHGHGPSQQVVGGRLFIQGMNCVSARDVYTGRVLWQREFPDLGTYQIYFDETYEETPLSTAYNQVHIPGANLRGTNYVATGEGVYLVIGSRCLLLDGASGATLREFALPAGKNGDSPAWGYVGVYEDLLLAGVGFGDYSKRLGYEYTPAAKKGVAWGPDYSGSLGLAAFDRRTGEIRWQIKANHSFLHNGIVAGGGRVYLLDKLPKRVEEQNRRRGAEDAATYRVLAVDVRSGEALWASNNVFGTWLSYSGKHDLLLQAGAAASDRSPDEVSSGMAVFHAADGNLVWQKEKLSYAGPCILHGDAIITNSTSYKESQGAFSLLDGSPLEITDPVTGEPFPWRFIRTYGCNTAVACENFLTFRSGAAGFYDLANHGGTGNFGGFKSGCTSSLIVADGVLNAPDYTRTCTCAYQNQTSLAMISMPENEIWTYSLFAQPEEGVPEIRRLGVNLGAPGDRLADDGTLWVNFPADEGRSPNVIVEANEEVNWYRSHSSRMLGGDLPWVAASGGEGIRRLTVHFVPPPKDASKIVVSVADSADDAEEDPSGEVDLTSSDLELTTDGKEQTVGIRFQKVPLAAGAAMKRAYVQFEVDEPNDEPTNLEIRGHSTDHAPAFAKKDHDVSSRPTTSALVEWQPKPWSDKAEPGPDHQTPDLRTILNEILGRPGWKPDQAIALLIRGTGKRVASSADGGEKGSPKLIVELDAAAGAAQNAAGRTPVPYSVRMVFAEPDAAVKPGDRVFDVVVQGETLARDLDIVAQAGGPMRSIAGMWKNVLIGDRLEIELHPKGRLAPVLCGVQIAREE